MFGDPWDPFLTTLLNLGDSLPEIAERVTRSVPTPGQPDDRPACGRRVRQSGARTSARQDVCLQACAGRSLTTTTSYPGIALRGPSRGGAVARTWRVVACASGRESVSWRGLCCCSTTWKDAFKFVGRLVIPRPAHGTLPACHVTQHGDSLPFLC